MRCLRVVRDGMVVLLVGFVILSSLIFLLQRKLIYRNGAASMLMVSPKYHHPHRVGLTNMSVETLHTSDGLELLAWYAPPSPGMPTILCFNPNAGPIVAHSLAVAPLMALGQGVLTFAYRSYDGNEGNPHEEGLYRDGEAALQFLRDHSIVGQQIILRGTSIGTAVATELAVRMASRNETAAALVLKAPFSNLPRLAKEKFWPLVWSEALVWDQYDSVSKIGRIGEIPLLIQHGTYDSMVPVQHAIDLHAAAKEPKTIRLFPAGHNDLDPLGGMHSEIAFLQSLKERNDTADRAGKARDKEKEEEEDDKEAERFTRADERMHSSDDTIERE